MLDLLILLCGMALNGFLLWRLKLNAVLRAGIWLLLAAWLGLTTVSPLRSASRIDHWMPNMIWVSALALVWLPVAAAWLVARTAFHRSRETDPARRAFLRAVGGTAVVAPAVGFATAISTARMDPVVREVELFVPGLHADLEGLRIVQLSDIHLSPFLRVEQLRRAVDAANELAPNVAVVTGDLISSWGDPLELCLQELSRLRSDAGTYGCLGNHEIMAGSERKTERHGAKLGMQFLRSRNAELRFGEARVNLAGVDYQRKFQPYLVGAQKMLQPDALNLLLSHNPDVFAVAAEQGWDVTLAGHTHGGQVTLEYLHPWLNPGLFYSPWVYGAYEMNGKSIFVTSGIGTVGVPMRVGAEPEVVQVKLRRARA